MGFFIPLLFLYLTSRELVLRLGLREGEVPGPPPAPVLPLFRVLGKSDRPTHVGVVGLS